MNTSELSLSETQSILQRHLEQRQLLTEVSHRIASSAGLAEILPHILQGICQATGAAGARIVLEEGSRIIAFAIGKKADLLATLDLPIHHFGRTLTGAALIWADEVPTELASAELSQLVSALMVLPLDAQQQRHGTLWIGFDGEQVSLQEDEREFVYLLTLQAAIAVANARTFEAARNEREKLAAILASAQDAVIMVDNYGKIQVFNPSAETLFEIGAHAVIGRTFTDIIQSEELQLLMNSTGDTPDSVEYITPDKRTFAARVSEVFAENGARSGHLLVLRDVTRFKRLVHNMSDFLHTVSHDLRSPLTAAKGFVDMLGMVGEINEKQKGMQAKILTSLNDMSNLVEKVLDAGRLDPEMGTYQLRRDTCDPYTIVNKIVSTLSPIAAQRNIELRIDSAPNIPVMHLDEMMVERALTNLVENAIKYSPEGSTVTIGLALENEHLVLSVSDNGYGIAPEDQARLFERGERIRRKEHRAVRGSGLGLFIVKNVAQQHGGNVQLISQVGEGSTFSILVPLSGANLVGSANT